MPDYRVGRFKGGFALIWTDGRGKRRRYRLAAKDAGGAAIEAPGLYAILTKPEGKSVGELWDAYVLDHADRAVVANMTYNWKALQERFAAMAPEAITVDDCRAHTTARRRSGIKDGTIATELGRLRMVLKWAEKRRLIDKAPHIERPVAPKRTERHLTREQCQDLIGFATMPHVKLFLILALGTGARNAALLELTWDRCNFQRGLIDLRNPKIKRPHKGRAIVPMNRTVRAALLEGQPFARTDFVIEWAGKPVASVKRSVRASAKKAGIKTGAHPHLLRHSAAVHMAEAGVPMEEIAQYLGHDDVEVTRKIYARFSPNYLRKAASVLEYDSGSTTPDAPYLPDEKVLENLVGATGIEPVTPTMSKSRPSRKQQVFQALDAPRRGVKTPDVRSTFRDSGSSNQVNPTQTRPRETTK